MQNLTPIKARFAGPCQFARQTGCGGIRPGQSVIHSGYQRTWHEECGPVGVDPSVGQNSLQALIEAQDRHWIDNTFGAQATAQFEHERYLDNHWED